jgi:hydroxymethylpyrimidine pyrophosphatase-like HAD family hydrolase
LGTFKAIASDYDSTLAHNGRVTSDTLNVLQRARAAGLKLILITGRTLKDLLGVFSALHFFDAVVIENGAVMFDPVRSREEPLCPAPPAEFLASLSQRSVPFSVGRRVVATVRPYDEPVGQVIEVLHVNLAMILNRESVMVLPRGVDKASGLQMVLDRMNIKSSDTVGIGDAENDIAFLQICGFSGAVANAIAEVKQQVHYVARGAEGSGVSEIINRVIAGKAVRTTK